MRLAQVDSVRHVPPALALRQRPGVPGVRSTFGTSTELLNVLRVIYSRVGSHRCPNGHRVATTIDVAANKDLVCPECGAELAVYGAGMVVPLVVIAALWQRISPRGMRLLRGRSFIVRGRELHTTSVITGTLLVAVSVLFWFTKGLVSMPALIPTDV